MAAVSGLSKKEHAQLDAEDLEVFKSGLEDLLKISINILTTMEEREMVNEKLRGQIETMLERVRLYQNDFVTTVNKDMDEHYVLFQAIYETHKTGILQMAHSFRSKGEKNLKWIAANGKPITVVIDREAQIVIHLDQIYKQGLKLQTMVTRSIQSKYQKLVKDGEDEDDAMEDMRDELEHNQEIAYANRLTLAMLTVFQSITEVKAERRILKSATSHLRNQIPSESGGGMFGNIGDVLGGFLQNMGGESGEGGAMDTITNGLKSALGGNNESVKSAIDRASKSKNLAELGQNISAAFEDPAVGSVVKEQVSRFTQGSQIQPPPGSSGEIPAAASTVPASTVPASVVPARVVKEEIAVDDSDDICLDD